MCYISSSNICLGLLYLALNSQKSLALFNTNTVLEIKLNKWLLFLYLVFLQLITLIYFGQSCRVLSIGKWIQMYIHNWCILYLVVRGMEVDILYITVVIILGKYCFHCFILELKQHDTFIKEQKAKKTLFFFTVFVWLSHLFLVNKGSEKVGEHNV